MSQKPSSSKTNKRKMHEVAKLPLITDSPVSTEVAVLAFYGIDHSAKSAKRFYNFVVSILSELRLTPTLCTISRKNSEIPWRRFKYVDKKMKSDGFRHVNGMELSCMLPDTDDPAVYFLYAGWSYDKEDNESDAFISIRSSIKIHSNWDAISTQLIKILSPKYAIGHECNKPFNGVLFSCGMGYASDQFANEAARRRRYSWQAGQSENVFLHGMIRDVFEWNCLNNSQLYHPLGELTLKEWIENDTTRGKLTQIDDELTLWEVDMKYESTIFETLLDADIIFDKDRHMYWFHEGRKLTPAERVALKGEYRKQEYDRLVKGWGPEKTEKWLDERGY